MHKLYETDGSGTVLSYRLRNRQCDVRSELKLNSDRPKCMSVQQIVMDWQMIVFLHGISGVHAFSQKIPQGGSFGTWRYVLNFS